MYFLLKYIKLGKVR